jgi:hypothetical protein
MQEIIVYGAVVVAVFFLVKSFFFQEADLWM